MRKISILALIVILLIAAACDPESTPTTVVPTDTVAAGQIQPPSTQAPTASPSPAAPQGVILEAVNAVDAHPYPDQDWEQALVEMPLFAGGAVWAKDASTSLVSMLAEAGLMRVAPNTILSLETPDANTLSINLQEGQIWLNIEGLAPGQNFQVQTPTAVASVRGTRFSVRVTPDGRTVVSVREGKVDVTTPLGSTLVEYGRQVTVLPDGSTTPIEKMPSQDFMRWGMACNSQLSIAQPLGEPLASFSITNTLIGGEWSYDGQVFQFITQERVGDQSYNHTMHYTPASGETAEVTVVPTTTSMAILSPVENRIAWTEYGDDGPGICTAGFGGEGKTCFGGIDTRYYLGDLAWSPDGQWLLYLLKDTMYSINEVRVTEDVLYRCRTDGSECQQLTEVGFGYISRSTWSPDGRQIAYAFRTSEEWQSPGQVWLMNADGTGATLAAEGMNGFDERDEPLAWSPDGQWLALGLTDGLILFNTTDASLVPLVNDPGAYTVNGWSPTPDGWPLSYSAVGTDGITRFYWLNRAETDPFVCDDMPRPIFSPDGTLAALIVRDEIDGQDVSEVYLFEVLPLWP